MELEADAEAAARHREAGRVRGLEIDAVFYDEATPFAEIWQRWRDAVDYPTVLVKNWDIGVKDAISGEAGGCASTLPYEAPPMPKPNLVIAIPGPYPVEITGDGKNFWVRADPPEELTSVEADLLAKQIHAAADRIRSLTKKKWTWGDTR